MPIDGTPNDDYLVGTDQDDEINGLGGNDIIDGGLGADDMDGGEGNDIFVVDNEGDIVRELLNQGDDLVFTSVSYTLAAGAYVETLSTSQHNATTAINLTGNAFANRLIGNYGANILNSGGGADVLIGLFGDDVYRVFSQDDQVLENAGEGTDTVFASASYALAAGQEVETLSTDFHASTAAINLGGNALDNTLIGNYGANVLNGGGGADRMTGFGGNDVYVVDTTADQVFETAGEGNDTILASVSYVLGSNQEVETLSTALHAGTAAIDLVGNQLANTLYGNFGNNLLNGNGGADTMIGFYGNDTYAIDNVGDLVVDLEGQGNDLVFTYVSHTLTNGNEIETLSTVFHQGTTAIDLGGNDYANHLIGNYGANLLNGGGGVDRMTGLNGNDTYVVENALDIVEEAAGGGNDAVLAFTSYTLAAGLEVETLSAALQSGTAVINFTGNELGQAIYGNNGKNVIDGKGGNDSLTGLGDADSFAFTTALGTGNVDTITDFSVAEDNILLSAAIFAAIAQGQVAASAIVTGPAATTAAHRIIYNSGTGALLYDSDGTGAQAAVQFATIAAGLNGADLKIFVEGPNTPPAANADANSIDKTATAPATGNVLANDTDPDPGQTLSVVAVQGNNGNVGQPTVGTFGTITINADGSYSYVVNPADPDTQAIFFTQSALEQFIYQISDGRGGLATATLTITVTGGKTLTDSDNISGAGSHQDTLSLDADTTITTASLFRGFELIILNTRRDEDNVDGHRYSFTLDNDNAPNVPQPLSGTWLTFDGDTLAADNDGLGPQISEDVFISSAAVTSFNLDVTTGAGNDTIVSGIQHDRIDTGAGNDIVRLTARMNDSVQLGTGFDILDLSAITGAVVLRFDAQQRLTVSDNISSGGSSVEGWDRIVGHGGVIGVAAPTMQIYGATGTGLSLDDLASKMENYTGLSIGYGELFFGNNVAAYTGPLPNITMVGGVFKDFYNGSLNFSQLSTGIVINPGQNVETSGGVDLFGSNDFNYDVTGTAFDDHIDRSDAFTNGAGFGSGHRFTLNGGDGNDYLKGGDVLNGGAGNDHIVASSNTVGSMLTGGAGADLFELPSRARVPGTNSQNNPYKVLDFNVADDTIYINIGLGGAPVAVTAAQFHIGTGPTTPEHRVIYNPATGALMFDANGSEGNLITDGNVHFATLPTGLTPTAGDFFFI